MTDFIKKFKPNVQYYGQLVIGPPGAGKSTYCDQMSKLLKKLGRKTIIVNLDPANDSINYKPDIDLRTLIKLEDVMEQHNLGPNGALLYCIEYLAKNIHWLLNEIHSDQYTNYIFDLPGQVELYSHHDALGNIILELASRGHINLCVVHLIDSHHCADAGKFIAALFLSLNAMLKLGLPHINLLTKVDLLKKHVDKLQFGLDFYTEVLDLNYLLDSLDNDSITSKYKKLHHALISVIEDYSLVTFQFIDVFSEKSLINVKKSVDKASGYVFKSDEGRHINTMLACAMGVNDNLDLNMDME